jgi:NADH-quinone oxidoreductase subunit N
MMSFSAVAPEVWIAIGVLGVVGFEALRAHLPEHVLKTAIPATALLALALALMEALFWNGASQGVFYDGTLVIDAFSRVFVAAACLGSLVILIYSIGDMERQGLGGGEYYALVLTATLGVLAIITAASLLVLYLGLELLSLSLYTLISIDRERVPAAEAAMKYFFLGAIASGVLLYGLSLLYGLRGTLSIESLSTGLAVTGAGAVLAFLAAVFVLVALSFKFGAAPFHMWVPDVYEGAPTPITLFVATLPELASIALFVRLLVSGLHPLVRDWSGMLIGIAILSLLIGNLGALLQSNFKRLLAYSAIGHVGFILLGIATGTRQGEIAAVYYTLVYVLMTGVAFGLLLAIRARGHDIEAIDDLAGLGQSHPWWSLLMLFAMFSLAGVPPFVGFWAKMAILRALLGAGLPIVTVFAVLMAVIGAFYYLRVVKVMYFDRTDHPVVARGNFWNVPDFILSLNGVALFVLGLVPNALWALCVWAVRR